MTYTYDNLGRFISSTETKSSNSVYKNNYSVEYDDYGRVCSSTNVIDYLASSTSYSLTLGYDYLYNTNGTLDAERFYLPQGGSIETRCTKRKKRN